MTLLDVEVALNNRPLSYVEDDNYSDAFDNSWKYDAPSVQAASRIGTRPRMKPYHCEKERSTSNDVVMILCGNAGQTSIYMAFVNGTI